MAPADQQNGGDIDVSVQSMSSNLKESIIEPPKADNVPANVNGGGNMNGNRKGTITTIAQGAKNIIDKASVPTNSNSHNLRRYHAAKQNFMRSMAGYSLLCYIL